MQQNNESIIAKPSDELEMQFSWLNVTVQAPAFLSKQNKKNKQNNNYNKTHTTGWVEHTPRITVFCKCKRGMRSDLEGYPKQYREFQAIVHFGLLETLPQNKTNKKSNKETSLPGSQHSLLKLEKQSVSLQRSLKLQIQRYFYLNHRF